MTSAWYSSQYVYVNNGQRKSRSCSLQRQLPTGLVHRPHTSHGSLCVVTVLDSGIKESSLYPEEPPGFLRELSLAYNNDYYKDLDDYQLQKQKARQNIRRHKTNNHRSMSFEVLPPNLTVCGKECTEKKIPQRNRPLKLLTHADLRLSQILPEDLNSTILMGHQIVNPSKDFNTRGMGKESSVGLEKNGFTSGLTSSSSIEHHYLQQCQQLQLQQRQHQQGQHHSQRRIAFDSNEESNLNGSAKFHAPTPSKKFQTRSSMPNISSSMPSIKVNTKSVESLYSDPMVNCPQNFHQRVAELILLESETIRWEKSKKLKKKPRDNS